MKKFFIVLIFIPVQLLCSINPYSDCLHTIVHIAKNELLSEEQKQRELKDCINEAYNNNRTYIVDNIINFFSPREPLKSIDEIITTGNKAAIKEYIAQSSNPLVAEYQIKYCRACYKKQIENNMSLAVRYFKDIVDDKELMATFLFNTRFRDVRFPPTMIGDRYHSTKEYFLQHPQLKFIFLDNVLRVKNGQLIELLQTQNPDVFRNAFLEGGLSLHLAVQINWYKMVEIILKAHPERVNDLDRINRRPVCYANYENLRMINLLKSAETDVQ